MKPRSVTIQMEVTEQYSLCEVWDFSSFKQYKKFNFRSESTYEVRQQRIKNDY